MEFRENKNQSWVNPPGILAMQGKKKTDSSVRCEASS